MKRVIFFGTYNVETTPRVGVLMDGMRANGVEVIECNVPLKVSTAERVAILRQPWRLPVLGWRIVGCWLQLQKLARKLPKADAVVVGYLGQFDIHLAKHLFKSTPLVLDCMVTGGGVAADRGLQGKGNDGAKMKLVRWLDESAFKLSDIIIVDTVEHQELLPAEARAKSVVVLVGAPRNCFDAGAKRKVQKDDEPLQVLFYGNYTPLQGAPVIGRAITRLKTPMNITMIGSGQDEIETKREASEGSRVAVTWIPWVDGGPLATLLASQDVCLGIFGTSAKAQRVVPNKVFAGAATGCAVITSDTAPQRRVLGDAARFVPAGDDEALAIVIEELAANRKELGRLQKASYELALTTFVPKAIVKPLLEKLAW
ncbi:MAG TPA: glycosyltransferase [Candidatus Saccharimonadales bacterium]